MAGWVVFMIRKTPRRGLADEIAEDVTRRVLAGEWLPEMALPSNRKLAESFGVSTLTVREAVKALEARGLIESRQGSGTYVKPHGSDGALVPWMIRPVDVAEYRELTEARRILESEIAVLAADRRTSGDLSRLRDSVERMERARTDAFGFLDADLDFHVALAETARNRILLRTMLAIRGPLKRLMAARVAADVVRDGSLDEAIADHQTLLRSIELRDPSAGRGAVASITTRAFDHLERIHEPTPKAQRQR